MWGFLVEAASFFFGSDLEVLQTSLFDSSDKRDHREYSTTNKPPIETEKDVPLSEDSQQKMEAMKKEHKEALEKKNILMDEKTRLLSEYKKPTADKKQLVERLKQLKKSIDAEDKLLRTLSSLLGNIQSKLDNARIARLSIQAGEVHGDITHHLKLTNENLEEVSQNVDEYQEAFDDTRILSESVMHSLSESSVQNVINEKEYDEWLESELENHHPDTSQLVTNDDDDVDHTLPLELELDFGRNSSNEEGLSNLRSKITQTQTPTIEQRISAVLENEKQAKRINKLCSNETTTTETPQHNANYVFSPVRQQISENTMISSNRCSSPLVSKPFTIGDDDDDDDDDDEYLFFD